MIQAVFCECGATSMLYGRCISCKRVRPSSKEVMDDISKNKKEYEKLLNQLEKAKKLEEEDNENSSIGCK